MKTLAAVALLSAGLATGSPPANPPQAKALNRACISTIARIRQALNTVEKTQTEVRTIVSRLEVVTPGTLKGNIAFNPAGTSITPAGDASGSHVGFGCAYGSGSPNGIGPGHSQIVSTVRQRFTRTGRYTLTFKLNRNGEKILERVATAYRAYRRRHPHGNQPPTIAVGVQLSYLTAG